MSKGRLEAFSDGVLAIIITIMVLEMKVPHGHEGGGPGAAGDATFGDLRPVLPVFLSYVLSFVYVGIYWNNHHHMLHAARRVNGAVLWANLNSLFWLSLLPFATGWLGENHLASAPAALYGGVLLMAAIAYLILQKAIIRAEGSGESLVARAVGKDFKGKVSLVGYVAGIALAFVSPWAAVGMYAAVALMWVVPDRRIERQLSEGAE
jgi:uncharacterized membrane protein